MHTPERTVQVKGILFIIWNFSGMRIYVSLKGTRIEDIEYYVTVENGPARDHRER